MHRAVAEREAERDKHDQTTVIGFDCSVAVCADQVVGTARLRALANDTIKAERVAVLLPFRRRGAGRALMQALEGAARPRGELVLNAQRRLPRSKNGSAADAKARSSSRPAFRITGCGNA
jgi:GNAT superfamily N-acetyltransferase